MTSAKPITIGFFDSGVGGLSVLREIESLGQNLGLSRPLRFVYLADTARCPYGNRPQAEIESFVDQIVRFLVLNGASAVVMACNTSAALALDTAKKQTDLAVFDLIDAVCRHIARGKLKACVMATAQTVKSRAFSKAINKLAPDLPVREIACPDLVPLVESGQISGPEAHNCLSKYAQEIVDNNVEAVVLGCTHFPFLAGALGALLPAQIEIIDPACFLVGKMEAYLRGLADSTLAKPFLPLLKEFYVTGSPAHFKQASFACLGYALENVSAVSIADLAAVPAQAAQVVPSVVASASDAAGSLS